MKKQFLLLLAIIYSTASMAQFVYKEKEIISYAPLLKSNDLFMKDKGLLMQKITSNEVRFYDEDFKFLGSVIWEANTEVKEMYYIDNLQGGIGTSLSMGNYAKFLKLTQTLFNDDESFEYVTYASSWELDVFSTSHFQATSPSGGLVAYIFAPSGYTFRQTTPYIYTIKDKNYIAIECKNESEGIYEYVYYQIDKEYPTAVREGIIPATASSPRRVYDINGKQIDQPTIGINIIKDGQGAARKVVVK